MAYQVLHVSHTDIRSDSRIIKEINCLSNSGYKVEAIGVDFDEGGKSGLINDNIILNTLNIRSNRLRSIKFFPKMISYSLIVLELTLRIIFLINKIRPDIIHCHDTLVLPGCVISKFFTKSKIIYDAHELESNKNGTSIIGGRLTFFVEKCLWGNLDAFITVSDSILEWYNKNLGLISNSAVILNSPVLTQNLESRDKLYLRNLFNIPIDSKVFVYVGILGEGRYIEQLVEIFKSKGTNSHLVFVGYGKLEKFLKDSSAIFDNIHLHEAVPHDELVAIISSADVGLCLLPSVSLSDYYCLPNKFFEYIFSGIPVISSKLPEMTKLIEGRALGVTTELDFQSVIESVSQFESAEIDIKVNFDLVKDLSWISQMDKLTRLYKKICN